jgi:hypothetical protein
MAATLVGALDVLLAPVASALHSDPKVALVLAAIFALTLGRRHRRRR